MVYKHGETLAAKYVREAEEAARKKAAQLAKLNAELDARIHARETALRHLKPVATYKPTPEAAAAWERFQATNKFPEPPEKGWRRLQAAAREAAEHDARKRHAA